MLRSFEESTAGPNTDRAIEFFEKPKRFDKPLVYGLKKPSRPPPPPPSSHHYPHQSSINFHRNSLSNNSGGYTAHHRRTESGSDYIKISECHTGLPENHHTKPMSFKSRASTSFSSTLKPSSSYFVHSSHQKSRSLTNNRMGSSYLYLDLQSSSRSSKNDAPEPASIVYNAVDFLKTEALNKCKVKRTSGRA